MDILTYFTNEWKVIRQAPVIFITGAVVIGLAMYWFTRLLLSDNISTLEERLKLRDDKIADYESKLNNASPDEAKARIDELEKRLTAFQADMAPRALTPEQKIAIRDSAAKQPGKVSVGHDGSCGDCSQFAANLRKVFLDAGWNVENFMVLGPGNPPPEGLSLRVPDISKLTDEAQVVREALQAAHLSFSLQSVGQPDATPQVLITARAQ